MLFSCRPLVSHPIPKELHIRTFLMLLTTSTSIICCCFPRLTTVLAYYIHFTSPNFSSLGCNAHNFFHTSGLLIRSCPTTFRRYLYCAYTNVNPFLYFFNSSNFFRYSGTSLFLFFKVLLPPLSESVFYYMFYSRVVVLRLIGLLSQTYALDYNGTESIPLLQRL